MMIGKTFEFVIDIFRIANSRLTYTYDANGNLILLEIDEGVNGIEWYSGFPSDFSL